MANIDTLTEGLYKLIHKLAGDSTTTDAQIEEALDNMTFVQACDRLIEEVEDGDLSIASGASTLATLNDTTITSATDGQVLKYNGSKWVNADDTDTDELEDLSDVALSTPSNGQVLTYDSTAGKWKNADPSGGGGSTGGGVFSVNIVYDDGSYTTDKTATEIYEAFQNEMLPIAIKDGGIYPLDIANSYDGETVVVFAKTYVNSGASTTVVTEMYQIVTSDGTTTVTQASEIYPAN